MFKLAIIVAVISGIFRPSYFKACESCTRAEMKRHYQPMIQHVSQNTNLPEAFIWSYFIIETGGKSNALINFNNPAGIMEKHNGSYRVKRFANPTQGIKEWIRVLNLRHYDAAKNCKGEQLYKEFGYTYHPDSSHELRYQVSKTWNK